MHLCVPNPVVSLCSQSPVLSDNVSGRIELCELLASTLGDEHLKAFCMPTLNCHSLLPSPQKCCMGLHAAREGEALPRCLPVFSFCNMLSKHQQKKKYAKTSETLYPDKEMKISLPTSWSPGLSDLSNLCVSSMMSPFLSTYSLVVVITDLVFCCCYHSSLCFHVFLYISQLQHKPVIMT